MLRMNDNLTSAILKSVSRSFYLSLAVLPSAVRPAIGLAYLLARAADTIADTRLIDRRQRITHLLALRSELEVAMTGRLDAIVAATRALPRAIARLSHRLPRPARRRPPARARRARDDHRGHDRGSHALPGRGRGRAGCP